MSKYSAEFKLKVISEYMYGNSSYNSLCKKYKIPSNSQLRVWINQYEQYGEEGLQNKLVKKKYSGEFKLRVLKYRQTNRLSYKETANHFDISQGSTIASWQRQYNEEGFEGLNRPIGRSKSMTLDKKNIEPEKLNESEREELIRLREENEFLRARHEYEKKLRALVQERERKTRTRRK